MQPQHSPTSPPLHHPHLQSLPTILRQIHQLLDPNPYRRGQAAQSLQNQKVNNFAQFLHQIIQLCIYVQKLDDRRLILLYLRSLFFQWRGPMPDVCVNLEKIVLGVGDSLKELAVQCMVVYLLNIKNIPYKRKYLDCLIQTLHSHLTSSTPTVPIPQIKLATLLLSHKKLHKKSGPSFTTKQQKQLHTIIVKHSLNLANTSQQIVGHQNWTKFILALCNYSGFIPSINFITKNIMAKTSKWNQIVLLCQMFNGVWVRDVEVLWGVLGRLMQVVGEAGGGGGDGWDDGVGYDIFVASISHAVNGLCRQLAPDQRNQDNQQIQNTIINQLSNNQFLKTLLIPLLTPLFHHPHPLPQSIHSLLSLTLTSLQNFLKLNETKICESINILFHELMTIEQSDTRGRSIIYQLCGNIITESMKFINYNAIICEGIEIIIIRSQQNGVLEWQECFVEMMGWYVRNCGSVDGGGVMYSIGQFLKIKLQKQIQVSLQPSIFALMCRYQIKSSIPTVQNLQQYEKILQMGYNLLSTLLSPIQTSSSLNSYQNSNLIEHIDTVLEALRQMSEVIKLQNVFYFHLVVFLTEKLQGNVSRGQGEIYAKFVEMLIQCLKFQVIQEKVFRIVNGCLGSGCQNLQQQGCQLCLKILLIANSHNFSPFQTPTSSSPSTTLLQPLLKTSILPFLHTKLSQQQQNPIHSQILLQMIIHQQIAQIIQKMLISVIKQITDNVYICQYYFDRVWEAIIIIYEHRNQYTCKKGIDGRVDGFKMGKIQELMQNMGICQQDVMREEFRFLRKCDVKWSMLPDVRRVIASGSIVGDFIDKKLGSMVS